MVTMADCVTVNPNTVFHHGECSPTKVERWRVNGKCQTWKRDTERFRLPVKHGLYAYGAITQDNASEFHRAEECKHGHW